MKHPKAQPSEPGLKFCRKCGTWFGKEGQFETLPIEKATDMLFYALLRHRAEKTVEHMNDVIKLIALVNSMHFDIVAIKHRRAIQIVSKNFTWIVPGEEDKCVSTAAPTAENVSN